VEQPVVSYPPASEPAQVTEGAENQTEIPSEPVAVEETATASESVVISVSPVTQSEVIEDLLEQVTIILPRSNTPRLDSDVASDEPAQQQDIEADEAPTAEPAVSNQPMLSEESTSTFELVAGPQLPAEEPANEVPWLLLTAAAAVMALGFGIWRFSGK
jgi:hypothetical protein